MTCMSSLRTFAVVMHVSCLLPSIAIGQAANVDRNERVRWIEQHASSIRTTDPADDDFSDLAPLAAAIGNSRVVMLGEQSHGDGTVFLAKTRIIKYLHEKLGFDVLAFESGFYDMPKAWSYLKSGEDPTTASRRGIFGIWSRTQELQPLFEYLGRRAKTDRPLELSGFDSQFTASASRDFFLGDLRTFLVTHGIDTTAVAEWPRVIEQVSALLAQEWLSRKPSKEKFDALLSGWADIQEKVNRIPKQDSTVNYWKQLLVSTKAYFNQDLGTTASSNTSAIRSVRDIQMGENLTWLAKEKYPNRKIIVWAATFHIMRNAPSINTSSTSLSYNNLTTMGHVVSQTLRNNAYAIGFVASEGKIGRPGIATRMVPQPNSESLEGLFASTKMENAFLNLQDLPATGAWLRLPIVAGALGYAPLSADWTRVLDGMIYTRRMAPSRSAN